MALPESAVEFLAQQAERIRRAGTRRKIVFPEGDDPRVQEAAARLASEGLAEPILLAEKAIGGEPGVTYVKPSTDPRADRYAAILYERRRTKGMTQYEASNIARRPLYFGCLMVAAGHAHAFLGGAVNSTADTVRAALHSIGTPPSVRTVSTFMVLCCQDRSFGHRGVFAIADTALVIEPTPVQLAEITIATAQSARSLLGIEPTVAMLSFSTKGSARHQEVEKVLEAFRIVQARAPGLHVDAELQADAAIVPAIARSKAPGSTVAGHANTLVFPDLNSANIGYKLVERLGDAVALGPFLQGLARPANDLSRGAAASDIYGAALVTAVQAGATPP